MATADPNPELHVMAGALIGRDGRVLVAQRPAGKVQAGRWEFPGGKKHPAETPEDGLVRELMEELGIEPTEMRPLLKVRHEYPAGEAGALPRRVLIDAWVVTAWRGTPVGLDRQALQWVAPAALPDVDLLEADAPLVTALRLPAVLARATDAAGLARRAARAPRARERLGWLLDAAWDWDAPDARSVLAEARAKGDVVLAMGPAWRDAEADLLDGVLVGAAGRFPAGLDARKLRGVEVGDLAGALAARAAGAHYLCVRDPALDARALEGLAAAGLPLVVDATRPRDGGQGSATTKLWWR